MILLPLNENAASDALAAGRRAPVGGPERLGRVLEEQDVVPVAHLADHVVVAALTVEVDREHGPDARTRLAPLRDRPVEEPGVDRPRRLVAVDEERRRARIGDRVRAGGEREARAGDLVARADPEHDEREVERRGPARQRHGVLDPRERGELPLERVHVRPEGGDPVRLDRVRDELRLAAGDVRRREVDARHPAEPTRGRSVDSRTAGRAAAILPGMSGHGMVFLGFGKYVRADRIYALEPITGEERGSGSRTLVWVEGIPEPVVASRTQETILAEIEDVAEPASRRRRGGRGGVSRHPQLFESE